MYNGDLTTDDMAQILENNDNVDYLPTTEQDAVHDRDGQFGRHYNEQFDPDQMGRRGTKVLNDPVNNARQPDGDHFDIVEQDLGTGNIYHNRVFDPGLGGGPGL